MTNDVHTGCAGPPPCRAPPTMAAPGPTEPRCFVFAGGMELHGHTLRNSGSIHIRPESAGARRHGLVFTSDSGDPSQAQHLMRRLPSEWGVLSFANMLLMEVNVPPTLLPLPGDQLLFGGAGGSEVVDSPTLASDKERQVEGLPLRHQGSGRPISTRCPQVWRYHSTHCSIFLLR